MFILFVNAFTSAFTTTQPTMDFDASDTPYPNVEKTQPGLYVDDEYFELADNYDYDFSVYDYNDDIGNYYYNDYDYASDSIDQQYVKSMLETIPCTISTVKSLIQKLENQLSILSSYMS